jgi:hypothetical protein
VVVSQSAAVGNAIASGRAVRSCESINVELLNSKVRFRVRDIFHPDPRLVMHELYSECVLEGRVLDVTESDGGAGFAVVEVRELQNPVLIALEHLRGFTPKGGRPV